MIQKTDCVRNKILQGVSLVYSKKGWEDDMINKNINLTHTFLLIQIDHFTFLENVRLGLLV